MILNKELLKTLSAVDISRYFAGGFLRIKYPADKEFIWTKIKESRGEKPKVSLLLQRGDQQLQYFPISDLEIDFQFPKNGLYDFHRQVMIVRRIPYRGTLKIPCPETLSILPLFGLEMPEFSLEAQKFYFNLSNLNEIFGTQNIIQQEQVSEQILLTTIENLKKTRSIGRILSRSFAASIPLLASTYPSPNLWYKNRIIGYILQKNIFITNPTFWQEAYDTFHDSCKIVPKF